MSEEKGAVIYYGIREVLELGDGTTAVGATIWNTFETSHRELNTEELWNGGTFWDDVDVDRILVEEHERVLMYIRASQMVPDGYTLYSAFVV